MDREAYLRWLSEIEDLSAEQREEAGRLLTGPSSLDAVLALLDERIGAERRCPHCAAEGAVIRGRSHGLKRYSCKGCGRTFNALTGTALAPVIEPDALLVTDGCTSYPPCAEALGISHAALNQTAGERVRGELHIQTINNRQERLKTFLRRHRGIATKYLDSYLRWFHLAALPPSPTSRAVLAAATGILPVRKMHT